MQDVQVGKNTRNLHENDITYDIHGVTDIFAPASSWLKPLHDIIAKYYIHN